MSEPLVCVLISGDRRMDAIMHNLGVFESFKVLAVPYLIKVGLNPDTTLEQFIKNLIQAANTDGQRVVAAFFQARPNGAYIDKTVKSISDGRQWVMLDKVLEAYGFMPS